MRFGIAFVFHSLEYGAGRQRIREECINPGDFHSVAWVFGWGIHLTLLGFMEKIEYRGVFSRRCERRGVALRPKLQLLLGLTE